MFQIWPSGPFKVKANKDTNCQSNYGPAAEFFMVEKMLENILDGFTTYVEKVLKYFPF